MVTSKETLKSNWYQHVQAWKQSQLSQKAYCEQHNLKSHQLSYWYRKFEQAQQRTTSKPHSNFLPVTLNAAQTKKADQSVVGLTLQLPNGICLAGIEISNLPVVQSLVKVLL